MVNATTKERQDAPARPRHLSFAEVAEYVARLTYKPGSRFEMRPGAPDIYHAVVHLTLVLRVPPADGSGGTVETRLTEVIPLERLDRDALAYWIERIVHKAEAHETDEWLKFDGQHVRPPHPEIKP